MGAAAHAQVYHNMQQAVLTLFIVIHADPHCSKKQKIVLAEHASGTTHTIAGPAEEEAEHNARDKEEDAKEKKKKSHLN